MLSFLIFTSLLTLGLSADHNTFKNCSRVPYCSALRTRTPKNNYEFSDNSLGYLESGQIQINVNATDYSENLDLIISKLEDNTFRLQLKEANSSRYELKDVLDGEPNVLPSRDFTFSDDYLSINSDDYEVRINKSPFSIEFYWNGELQLIFDGSRLTFDKNFDQAFAFGVSFPKASQLYGIHEHADNLALQTTRDGGTDPYRLRNLDVPGYELKSPMALYGSVPVLYGHGPNGTVGIFLHNAAEQWVEVTNDESISAYIMVESGSLDLFVLTGPTPKEVVRQYVRLTGTAHLPQLWALGYHQSRYSYMTQDDLKDVVANFGTYDFPLDVIWLDIDYTNGKRYFTWNSTSFSDPVEMQRNISASHKRLVTIIDPHIKVEEGYNVYDGAIENEFFVTRDNGSVFEGDCWPGLSSWVDFLNPEARTYYGSFYSYDNFPYTTPVLAGIWNDMNEPSVFDNSIENTLPSDALHHGGVVHRDVHNIYGFLHTMATHQGLLERDNSTTRPFVLSRSHFAGTQRYSAIWTGDNQADWGYISASYSECLDANLLGIVFCGADVGGFSNDPSEELLQRWYQAGAWLPFYRAHSDMTTQRREPYLFNVGVQGVIRDALRIRYRHLPVWYTLFYEHTRNRDPIIRPLFYQYPQDENVYKLSDHLLLGSDILVRAVAEPGVKSVAVYFPGGAEETWISVSSSETYQGSGFVNISVNIQGIPVFYRRGSLIVRKDTERLSSDEMADDGHTLHVNLDTFGKATGTIYLDDNTSFDYINNKNYNYLRIDVQDTDVTLTTIDEEANSDGFDFIIDAVVINSVVKQSTDGKPGQYESKVFKVDASGQLLKNLKLKAGKPVTFSL